MKKQADAADGAAGSMSALADATALTVDPIDEATAAASAFDTAIGRVINRQLGVAGATTNYAASFQAVKDAILGTLDASATAEEKQKQLAETMTAVAAGFDVGSEAGRKNREVVQANAADILDLANKELAAGDSIDVVKGKTLTRVQALKDELAQLGFNEGQIDDYIAQLGLTPETVTTAFKVTGDEEAKRKASEVAKSLGDATKDPYIAKIQAEIDRGHLAAAYSDLERLTATRIAKIQISLGQPVRVMAGGRPGTALGPARGGDGASLGGYFATVGEAGRETMFMPAGAEMLNNATTRRLEEVLSRTQGGGAIKVTSSGTVRLHQDDINRLAQVMLDNMPPLVTMEQPPYSDAAAIASKIEARWRRRRGF